MFKKSSFSFVKISLFSFLLVLILFALFFSVLAISTSSVAFADSSNGIVEDNLLFNSSFENIEGSTSYTISLDDYWQLSGSGTNTRTFSNNTLSTSVVDTNGVYAYLRQDISSLERGVTYHYRVQSSSHNYSWLVQTWYYSSPSSSPVAGQSSGYLNASYIEGNITLPSNYPIVVFLIQTRGSVTLEYSKIELGSSFTGYVSKDYTNYGYNQGLEYNFNNGLDLIQYNSVINDLSINYAVSTGSVEVPINDNQLTTLQLVNLEQLTRPSTLVSNPYHFFEDNLLYNVMYASSNASQTAGFYGVKISVNNLGIYNFIPANSTFYLTFNDGFGVIMQNDYFSKSTSGYLICFFDTKGNIILNNNFKDTNFITNPVNYNDVLDNSIVNDGYWSLSSLPENSAIASRFTIGSTMYFNLPYNVAYVGIIGYFNANTVYYCYNGKLGFLPSNNYTDGFNQGYEVGKSNGIVIGRNHGYKDAQDYYARYGQDYSFMSLMTAVVDAPIEVLGDILDFNIFGYNLKAFVFSILAIGIVILIIGKFV